MCKKFKATSCKMLSKRTGITKIIVSIFPSVELQEKFKKD